MRYCYYQYTTTDKNGDIIKCVKCVSHYAQKEVQGVAKCHPDDTFDFEKGKEIARARCDVKVAERRFKQALAERAYIYELIDHLNAVLEDKEDYVNNALLELEEYQKVLEEIDPRNKTN